jgi:hypothetical protein
VAGATTERGADPHGGHCRPRRRRPQHGGG